MWKPVVGHEEFYEVSDSGVVRSLPRKLYGRVTGKVTIREARVKELQVHRCGYLKVWLKGVGKRKMYFVHRLVASAFIENEENRPQVNHKDGNKKNNCVENLEWATAKENIQHAYREGLNSNGSGADANNAKLTEHQVKQIVALSNSGQTIRSIACEIGCLQSTVQHIVSGSQWSSLTGIQYQRDESKRERLTPDKVKDIVRLRDENKSYVEIDEITKCGRHTAFKICSGLQWSSVTGIQHQPDSSQREKLTHSDVMRIVQLRSEGCSFRVIDEITKCGRATAFNVCSGRQWSSVTGITYTRKKSKASHDDRSSI